MTRGCKERTKRRKSLGLSEKRRGGGAIGNQGMKTEDGS